MNGIRKLEFEEIHDRQPTAEELQRMPRFPIAVIADNIRSVYNVGALFRTADGARIAHLYLCGITGTPPRDDIRKTSLGAEETVPWSYENDAAQIIKKLRARGYQIVVLEHTDKSVDYSKAELVFPVCLIIGNEYLGVQEHLIQQADLAVEIPMYGVKQSLNVSVAFGVVIYEFLKVLKRDLEWKSSYKKSRQSTDIKNAE